MAGLDYLFKYLEYKFPVFEKMTIISNEFK